MSDTKAANHVLATLQGEIRVEMNDRSDYMTQGAYSTLEAYREAVGEIYGLAKAESLLLALSEKLEDD